MFLKYVVPKIDDKDPDFLILYNNSSERLKEIINISTNKKPYVDGYINKLNYGSLFE